MTNEKHVLIVSTRADVATDDVVRRLAFRGMSHTRLNTEDFPFTRRLAVVPELEPLSLLVDGERLPFPTAVWYRRLRTPSKPSDMDDGIYQFCLQENRSALLGSLLALPSRWMSYPASVWKAEFKPFQLALASRIGLPIPQTVITNDPATIRDAFTRFGSMIAKPVRTGYVTHQGEAYSIFTTRVLEEHLHDLEAAKWSPAIYQALVPKRYDIRVTIVGRLLFAAAIHSQSDPAAIVDWRHTNNPELPHERISLPESLVTKLFELMDSLGLAFGAIDLVECADGGFVFLEVNPSGQWLWLDDVLNLGISDAVADWLAQSKDDESS